MTIEIKLDPQAIRVIQKFEKAPGELPQAIARGMTRALEITTGRIQEKRLSGKGPFSPLLHRLGQVTQQLVRSTRATPAVVISQTSGAFAVEGAIASSVVYAAAHEFGFNGLVSVRASGRAKAHRRQMNIPERAPFRTGIKENSEYIGSEIEKEIMKALKA